MDTLFILCAVFGGTILLAQSLLGLGGGDHGLGDHDLGGDVAGDMGGDLGGDAGADADVDVDDISGERHGSTWFFGVLSFRTVVIGLTFFGLIGKSVSASGFEDPQPLIAAIVGGLGAMYGVYFLMQALSKLNADGTQRIELAVGVEGVVYLAIPAHSAGAGKIHITLQDRLVELEAVTAGERLPTGSQIVVVGVLGPGRVEVEPLTEPARETHV
jgi:hypothetical protein